MRTEEARPGERTEAGNGKTGEDQVGYSVADVPDELIRRADRALRAALREGVISPEVEALQDWVSRQRIRRRKRQARAAVADVLAEIDRAEDVS